MKSIVDSTLPDTGMAVSELVPPPSPAPAATTNDVDAVWVVPFAVRILTVTSWGPTSSGVVGVYVQEPLASAVTVAVSGVE